MSSLNKVMLLGRLGEAPKTRYLPDGTCVANISLATSEKWKDKDTGEKNERTEWHRISLFGKVAEIAKDYLDKGSLAYFEGKLQTRKWQDKKTGEDRYITEIIASEMKMLSSPAPKRDGIVKNDPQLGRNGTFAEPASAHFLPTGKQPGAFDDMPDDIPF